MSGVRDAFRAAYRDLRWRFRTGGCGDSRPGSQLRSYCVALASEAVGRRWPGFNGRAFASSYQLAAARARFGAERARASEHLRLARQWRLDASFRSLPT